jgi:hypothetical protein
MGRRQFQAIERSGPAPAATALRGPTNPSTGAITNNIARPTTFEIHLMTPLQFRPPDRSAQHSTSAMASDFDKHLEICLLIETVP